MVPAVDFQWLPGTRCKKIFEVQGDYKRYLAVADNDGGFPSEVLTEAVADIDDVFSLEVLWETGGGSSFAGTDYFVIATALNRPSKHFPSSSA